MIPDIETHTDEKKMVFGKLVFDRKVMGRLATERKAVEKTGAKVDFEHFTDTCEARVRGSEESVSRALTILTEVAQCCGYVPSM